MRVRRCQAWRGGITWRTSAQPRSWRRASSRNAEPKRARSRSLSRTERHQRASQSRSLGPTNLAIRAHPARKPAAAFERGLTASQRCSSRSTSRPGFGPRRVRHVLARSCEALLQLAELILEFETPLTLSAIVSHADPDGGQVLRDLPRTAPPGCNPSRASTTAAAPGAAEYGTPRVRAGLSGHPRAPSAFSTGHVARPARSPRWPPPVRAPRPAPAAAARSARVVGRSRGRSERPGASVLPLCSPKCSTR